MDLILRKVTSEFHGDERNIAVLAHSFGARSALIFVAQHPEVKAFVSLDGGIGNAIGKDWIKQFTDFKPASIRTPILHFYQNVDSNIVIPDLELHRSLKNAECSLRLVKDMHHYYFSSVGFIAGYLPDFSRSFDEELSLKCQSYAYYTLEFLNRHAVNKNDELPDDADRRRFKELTALQELK